MENIKIKKMNKNDDYIKNTPQLTVES